jgi:hypothetical protein
MEVAPFHTDMEGNHLPLDGTDMELTFVVAEPRDTPDALNPHWAAVDTPTVLDVALTIESASQLRREHDDRLTGHEVLLRGPTWVATHDVDVLPEVQYLPGTTQ